jgi:hypothetical protein
MQKESVNESMFTNKGGWRGTIQKKKERCSKIEIAGMMKKKKKRAAN